MTDIRAPDAREPFNVIPLNAARHPVWYHVYSTAAYPKNGPLTFSQGSGNARFSPLKPPGREAIATYYVADSVEAALVESVLHDVVLGVKGVKVGLDLLEHQHLATVKLTKNLRLVSFQSVDLNPLGLTREQLIASLPVDYPHTRRWAQAAFDACPKAQGLIWTSRRDDRARCLMLFQERLPKNALKTRAEPEDLWLAPRRSEFIALCKRMSIGVV